MKTEKSSQVSIGTSNLQRTYYIIENVEVFIVIVATLIIGLNLIAD